MRAVLPAAPALRLIADQPALRSMLYASRPLLITAGDMAIRSFARIVPRIPTMPEYSRQISKDNDVDRIASALGLTVPGLARRLGLSVGTVRFWKLNGLPPYGKLALAALLSDLDPDPDRVIASIDGPRSKGEGVEP